MSGCVEKHPPEIAGLVAANNGLALVETACTPASRLVRAASFWWAASAKPVFPVPTLTLEKSAPSQPPTVQTVVLRGQPPSRVGRRHL
jgi:hypothetical protein